MPTRNASACAAVDARVPFFFLLAALIVSPLFVSDFFWFLSLVGCEEGSFCFEIKNLDSVCHRGNALFNFLFQSIKLRSTEEFTKGNF